MKRSLNRNILILAAILFAFLFAPAKFTQTLRSFAIAMFTFGGKKDELNQEGEIKRLKLENQLLNQEVVRLKDFLEQELNLLAQGFNEHSLNHVYSAHQKRILDLYQLQLSSLPARVIFRSANAWNSSLWINLGERDNAGLEHPIVVKNSPVVLGDSVVGIVDFVGKKQSRVRLITDSGLNLAVRILRDGLHLAKGEITGQSLPLWRSHEQILVGTGFNYDFPDSEGPSRDLRTGEPLEGKGPSIPIVQPQDLLVTTGMDGVFPPGLKVGTVSNIFPLKEGDYYFNLEAIPAVGNLQELTLVFVLPPLGFHFEEKAL